MAAIWLFRLAIAADALSATSYAILTSPQPPTAQQVKFAYDWIKAHLLDGWESDAELAAALNAAMGYDWEVTTWAEGTDLRKLQIRYSRAPSGSVSEDVAVTTHTFLKVTGGVASGTWTDPTDYAAVETAFGTLFTALKFYIPAHVHLDQYRWYIDNAALRLPDHAPNPALRVTEVDVAGTQSGAANLPPQIAVSVSEITASRKSWGRFYLPMTGAAGTDVNGRFSQSVSIADAVKTFYNSCRAAGLYPVVYAPGLPARSSAAAKRAAARVGPGTVPEEDIAARSGVIYEVTSIQIDDLYDVIRSRRWDKPTVRTRVALT